MSTSSKHKKLLSSIITLFIIIGFTFLRSPTETALGTTPESPASSTPGAEVPGLEHQLFYFEPNLGQAGSNIHFAARAMGGVMGLEPASIGFRLPVTDTIGVDAPPLENIALQFVGSNPNVQITGTQELSATVNYYLGGEPGLPGLTLTGVPAYGEVIYDDLYPGIDLSVKGAGEHAKLTFIVAPLADPKPISWSYAGADGVVLDPVSGDLLITFGAGKGHLIDAAPQVWQEMGQETIPISATYVLNADNSVSLALGAYNPDLALIFDPNLVYSTYWGGSQQEAGASIALDSANNACITGDTTSFAPGGFNDVYITCFSPTGSWLYTTIVGGNSWEGGSDLIFDSANRLYVTGPTWSSNFPSSNTSVYQGGGDAFVLRLTGGLLTHSGFLGGTNQELGFSVAVDSGGDIYAVGSTLSTNFAQITAGTALYPTNQGIKDMFIVKLNNTLSAAPLYGSYFGGTLDDCDFYKGCQVAVDATNGVYVAGNTDSSNFPVLNSIQPFNGGGTPSWAAEAFVSKLTWSGSALTLVYSTYLGGTGFEENYGLAVDSAGNAIVVGTTSSTNFPTTTFALQPAFGGGNRDAYTSKLKWNGTSLSLAYSSYLGGTGMEEAHDVTIHQATDTAYLTGITDSPNFPTFNALYPTLAGSADVFVTGISSNGANYHYSTYMGSAGDDGGNGIAVDSGCDTYLTGGTNAGGFPTQNASNPFYQGNGDAFVTRLGSTCPTTITPNVNNLTLNQGEVFTETLTVTIPAQPPCVLDVYFLADTTGSMGGILSSVASGANSMLASLATQLPNCNIAYGVGEYKDYIYDPFAFQHMLSVTTNTANVQTAINTWTASGGADWPEGQLYALYKLGQNNAGSIGWRPTATKKMVVWFGDAPGHDPICQSIHNDGTIPFAVTLANTTAILNSASIQVIAIDVGLMNGSGYASDYFGCIGNQAMTPAGQAVALASATGGSYQSVLNPANIVSTIVSQVTALTAPPITNVSLIPSASLLPFITSISPAGGYGPLDPTIPHSLPFTVTFMHDIPCSDVPQVITGTLNVTADGMVIATKTVTITIPACKCVAPPFGMVAWWPLNETTGFIANDIVGGHTGYDAGSYTHTVGMVSNALDYDGIMGHTRVPPAPALNFGPAVPSTPAGDFSIDAWINWDTFNPLESPIVSKWDGFQGYYLFIDNGRLSLVLADGSGATQYFISSAPLIPTGVWTHVAVTVDRDNVNGITFYVNGLPIGTQDPTGRMGSLVNAEALIIGVTGYSWQNNTWVAFDGRIDEVELFNRVVTPGEILGIFQARNAGKCKPKPQPDLAIHKTSHGPFVIGSVGTFVIQVKNVGAAPAAGPIVVTDTLPPGFIPPIVAGGAGWTCTVAGSTVTCTHPGPLAVGGVLPPIVIQAMIGDQIKPQVENCATVHGPNDPNPANDTDCVPVEILHPSPDLPHSDLGDAPASDNSSGAGMTTYGGAVTANFPTVFGAVIPGPLHAQPKIDAWLGIDVTSELDADLFPDMDGLTNIDPPANLADQDLADDGVRLKTIKLPRCQKTRFQYDLSVVGGTTTRYLNVWFDFNHDGDWNDTLKCKPAGGGPVLSVPEWAVTNSMLSLGNGYYPGLYTPYFISYRGSTLPQILKSRWMRITVSDQPGPAAGDGSGPAGGYKYGETEDYLLRFHGKPIILNPHLSTSLVMENSLFYSDTLVAPSGAVTREITLAYFPDTRPVTQTQDLLPVGINFSLEAYSGDDYLPDLSFEQPISLTLRYGDGAPDGALNIPSAVGQLGLYVWQDGHWVQAACGPYQYDPEQDRLTVPICSTGEFALFSEGQRHLYLPLTFK